MSVKRVCNSSWPETIVNIREMYTAVVQKEGYNSDRIVRDLPCDINKQIEYGIWVTINNRLNLISKLLVKKLEGEPVEQNVEDIIDLYHRSIDRIM